MFPTPIHPTDHCLVVSKVEKNGASQDGALPVDNAEEKKVRREDSQNQETTKNPNSVISLWIEVLFSSRLRSRYPHPPFRRMCVCDIVPQAKKGDSPDKAAMMHRTESITKVSFCARKFCLGAP